MRESVLWAAKSGLQKAIRRSDLSLVKTCFEVLWGTPKGRSWLKWRLPILAEEDVWYMVPECQIFLNKYGDIKRHTVVKKEWLKFLFTLALVPKSKDSEPLYYLAVSKMENPPAEVSGFRKFLAEDRKAAATPYDMAKILSHRVFSGDIDLTDYEMEGITLMVKRSQEGGLQSDPWCCLSCIYLIMNRGIGEYEVKETIDKAYRSVKERPVSLNSFPWWVFDQHTALGKKVTQRFPFTDDQRKYANVHLLRKMMFLFESAYIPRERFNPVELKSGADCFESILWVPYMINELRGRGKPVKAFKGLWESEYRPKLQNLIEDEMRRSGMLFIHEPEQQELF